MRGYGKFLWLPRCQRYDSVGGWCSEWWLDWGYWSWCLWAVYNWEV